MKVLHVYSSNLPGGVETLLVTLAQEQILVEALYARPVVTTAIGGGVEIVDESCGKLVAPNDAKALSKVLGSLITNSAERAYLAAGGRSRAEQLCDPARQMSRLYDLLSQLGRQEAVA